MEVPLKLLPCPKNIIHASVTDLKEIRSLLIHYECKDDNKKSNESTCFQLNI